MKWFLKTFLSSRKKLKLSLSTKRRVVGGVDIYRNSCLAWALDEGKWSTSRPGRFIPGKEVRHPLNKRLGGPQSRYGRFGERTILPQPGFSLFRQKFAWLSYSHWPTRR